MARAFLPTIPACRQAGSRFTFQSFLFCYPERSRRAFFKNKKGFPLQSGLKDKQKE